MAFIDVRHITRSFGRIKALYDISFQINQGEVVGLLGPNGAGKTTAMRIITTFLPPSGGEVFINGKNISYYPLEIKKMIGYLPEDTPLYGNMKVEEFLIYCANLKGFTGKKGRAAISGPIEQCSLEDVKGRIIRKLSKGYRQRVGLAQALIGSPPILILDEPTIGLDPNQVVHVRNLIRELRKDRTIILSTHILSEVEAVCEKVIVIHNGRIAKESSLKELTSGAAARISVEIKGDSEKFLSACRGIENTNIEKADDGKIVVHVQGQNESLVREKLFQAAVSTQTILLEMRKDRLTLESIFMELTKSL
jgi:ABC-2 type transport system ATP-binding protein